MKAVGFLGVGHLAEALIVGLLRSDFPRDALLLSPRGRASHLAAEHGLRIAASNAELVAQSESVVLAVRPKDAPDTVRNLPWRAEHVLISACAGVPISALETAGAPATVCRIMPLTAAALGASPTTLYPDVPQARALIAQFGSVIALARESDFEVATVSAAVYCWAQDLIARSGRWASAHDLSPEAARQLSALTFVAAGRLIAERPESMDDLLTSVVTPGGITERGLNVLEEHGVGHAWDQASDAVLAKLTGRER